MPVRSVPILPTPSFDMLNLQTNYLEELAKVLSIPKRYLEGDFDLSCANALEEFSRIARRAYGIA